MALKYAMTLDGKIAACTGASQWITGEAARRHVHQLRHRYRGILAGVGTVLADDPQLTCRLPEGRSPVRVVCDTRLRTPAHRPGGPHGGRGPHPPGHLRAGRRSGWAPYQAGGVRRSCSCPEREGHVDLGCPAGTELGTAGGGRRS